MWIFVLVAWTQSAMAQQPVKVASDGAIENAQIQISNVFPNPASQQITFNYRLASSAQDAKITFFTVLGSKVAEMKLSQFDESVTLPIENFKVGVYLYTISVNNQNVATRKLVVKR